MPKSIEQIVGELLAKSKKSLAVAESCTGGLLSNMITNIAGSSAYFVGGVVAYTNQSKIDILKVPEKIIQEDGVVSKNCAIAMAKSIRATLRTDVGLGITGFAGPSGGSGQIPVGSIFIAVTNGGKNICKLFKFEGNRLEIKMKASQAALKMIKEFME